MTSSKSATNKTLNSTGGTGVSVGALPPAAVDGVVLHENALAGLLLYHGDQTLRLCADAGITPQHFSDAFCRKVFQTVFKMHSEGIPLDLAEIVEIGDLDPQSVEKLVDQSPIPDHAEFYIGRLVEGHAATAVREVLETAMSKLADHDPTLVAVEAGQKLASITPADNKTIVDAGQYIDEAPPPHDPIIVGLFEAGDKVGIIASAKRKKSWFTLQLALSVAAGRSFLGWSVARPRKVLIVQPEIKPAHYHRRVHSMAAAMGLDASTLAGRLGVCSCRGMGLQALQIATLARSWAADLVVVDPLYKLSDGDENKAQDIKPLLAVFDSIATQTGAAVCWVHHDAKGSPGDRDARDRGAGSNILIRDVDQLFTLTPHRDDPDATVVETLARNYEEEGPKTIKWTEGCFHDSDLAAVAKTSSNVSKYSDALRSLDVTEPGLSTSEAAARLGCDKSTISRLRRRYDIAVA